MSRKSSVWKHSNLPCNMIPRSFGSHLLELTYQISSDILIVLLTNCYSLVHSADLPWFSHPCAYSRLFFVSAYHCTFSLSSPSIIATSLAPCTGGVEYMGLTILFKLLITIAASCGECVTMWRAPTLCPTLWTKRNASTIKTKIFRKRLCYQHRNSSFCK